MYLRREDRGVVDRMWLHGGTPRLDVRAGMGMGSVPEASGELTCSTGNGARGYVSRCSEGVVVIDRCIRVVLPCMAGLLRPIDMVDHLYADTEVQTGKIKRPEVIPCAYVA